MFGNQLSNDTLEAIDGVLTPYDREVIEMTTVDKLRSEVEYAYDDAKGIVMGAVHNNSVITAETERFNEIQRAYSLLMQEIESHLDKGGILL